ncbi:prepilin-type N-terminal cleavage/methylation domain-containing protein [Pseudactinotalea terrae]|uniref:prepilin-type N-terminal cleavage/methylation domain-containing protein n=1 Tax=Pseudactinotalea terrae TaxID=1743262 RepID=UPI0012E0FC21|nr:prepilin-type N-terminal cleavage/methylation domain-containing protein [Pseudactinotalea terrae]
MLHKLRNQHGITLPELLVAMVILAAVVLIGTTLVSFTGRLMHSSQASAQTMSDLESASSQLQRDVQDARRILDATPDTLQLEVLRDSACVLTTWTVTDDATLNVERVTFTQADTAAAEPACADTGGERATLDVVDRFTETEPFAYFARSSTSTPLTVPVPADEVARVTWQLTATPSYPEDADPRTVTSGAALAQRTGTSGDGVVGDALAPLLDVTTAHEGVNQPVLTWQDPTTELTQTWTVFRIAYPEGGTANGSWAALITLPGTQLTYTDTGLPAGHTARYLLRATLTDNRPGPTSNQVATGIRPAPVTLTATGQDASIRLSWPAATGAVAYDLYRDGTLYQTSLTGTTWTDPTGRGHTHTYRVVPINRWERCATRAATCTEAFQSYQVALGTADTLTMPGGATTAARRISTVTAAAGAFTSPLAPTLTVTPNSNWSNTLTWAVNPSWTGNGPTSKDGHRDRGWVARVAPGTGTAPGTWPTNQNVWSGAETARGTTARAHALTQAAVAGQYRHYQIRTCNAVGCSPWSSVRTVLQRPHVPTCTAVMTGSTRSGTVTVARPSMPSTYTSTRVNGGTAAVGNTVGGLGDNNMVTWPIDRLRHGTTHTFTVANRNGSPVNGGWSDNATCSSSTRTLAIRISATSSTTKAVSVTATATEGTTRTITLEGLNPVNGVTGTWEPLRDNTGFAITARNSDGVNHVSHSGSVSTKDLTVTPAPAPTCSAWADDTYAPTTVRWSSNGTLSRTALSVYSGGYYSATATITHTNTDGFNTASDSASSSCGASVLTMLSPNTGSSGGIPNGSCALYRSNGAVASLLNAAGTQPGSGFYTGSPSSGSFAADYGSLLSGSISEGNLSCMFYRSHPIYFSFNNMYWGEYLVAARWSMGGSGGV